LTAGLTAAVSWQATGQQLRDDTAAVNPAVNSVVNASVVRPN